MEIDRDNTGHERLMSGGTTKGVEAIPSRWKCLASMARKRKAKASHSSLRNVLAQDVTQYHAVLDPRWQQRETSGAFSRFCESVKNEGRGDSQARWVAIVSRDVSIKMTGAYLLTTLVPCVVPWDR